MTQRQGARKSQILPLSKPALKIPTAQTAAVTMTTTEVSKANTTFHGRARSSKRRADTGSAKKRRYERRRRRRRRRGKGRNIRKKEKRANATQAAAVKAAIANHHPKTTIHSVRSRTTPWSSTDKKARRAIGWPLPSETYTATSLKMLTNLMKEKQQKIG